MMRYRLRMYTIVLGAVLFILIGYYVLGTLTAWNGKKTVESTMSPQHYIEEALTTDAERDAAARRDAEGPKPSTLNDRTKPPEDDPLIVIAFAYMRGGSTFLGRSLYNHPDVFYLYEPLFDIYLSMVSADQRQHPLHITFNENRTFRHQSPFERHYLARSLLSMMNCRFHELPTESLTTWTKYPLNVPPLMAYSNCLQMQVQDMGVTTEAERLLERVCQHQLHDMCPHWTSRSLENRCHEYMAAANSANTSFFLPGFPPVSEYLECTAKAQKAFQSCSHILEKLCHNRTIKAVKIIRGRMTLIEDLAKIVPRLKVIHQLRDPRGIIQSRRKKIDFFTFNNVSEEARFLCSKMLDDLVAAERLKAQFPGLILTTRYEDTAADYHSSLQRLYRHLGVPLPQDLQTMIEREQKKKKKKWDFDDVANAWRRTINQSDKKAIDLACLDLFKKAAYII